MNNESKLGKKVKDRVSGFTGIAVSETKYLQGCNRIVVQPTVKKDGTLPEAKNFDEPDLIVIDKGVGSQENAKPGGPRPIAVKP